VPTLQEQLGLANVMQVPRPTRSWSTWRRRLPEGGSPADAAVEDLDEITARNRDHEAASRSPASSPRGDADALKVTLRGDRMWEFLDRLISLALPRIRDFAASSGLVRRSNYTFGVTES